MIKKSLKLKVYLPGKIKNGDKFGSDLTVSLTSWDSDGKENLTDINLLLKFNMITKKLKLVLVDIQLSLNLVPNSQWPQVVHALSHLLLVNNIWFIQNMRCQLTNHLSLFITINLTWANSSLTHPRLTTNPDLMLNSKCDQLMKKL